MHVAEPLDGLGRSGTEVLYAGQLGDQDLGHGGRLLQWLCTRDLTASRVATSPPPCIRGDHRINGHRPLISVVRRRRWSRSVDGRCDSPAIGRCRPAVMSPPARHRRARRRPVLVKPNKIGSYTETRVVAVHRWTAWPTTYTGSARWCLPARSGNAQDCHASVPEGRPCWPRPWGWGAVELLNRRRWKTRIELANAIFNYSRSGTPDAAATAPWSGSPDSVREPEQDRRGLRLPVSRLRATRGTPEPAGGWSGPILPAVRRAAGDGLEALILLTDAVIIRLDDPIVPDRAGCRARCA